MAAEPLKWYDDKADNPPWIKALAEVRHRATREGYRYQHVQATIVAIDQYAEAALSNRDFFFKQAPQHRRLKDEGRSVTGGSRRRFPPLSHSLSPRLLRHT
ncbi:hypothetical protein [Bradyrhizobium sp. Ash2021]|uniref:hypothetical protein n=1 Tax=Bradyrhizobium sp. Ash2021 TaxID=2954771 RepID=UPI00281513B9|nr:hypothetical protein [Bradyrhizobium sp. Ash2021]